MAYRDRERQREYERRWYENNRDRVIQKKSRKRARLRAWAQAAKDRPCADCGVRYPYYVMDFDHVTGDKLSMVSTLVTMGATTRLMTELEKCEAVCANCHRIRTWQRAHEPSSPRLRVDGQAGGQLALDGLLERDQHP